ncbi:MAG: disulfide bond formation protein DsbD [Bacteroidetes bacterium 4572_117]|nr:MAG: disulfide bond formation protein DsbD [Bacteroidetes bacterium 4572_117]
MKKILIVLISLFFINTTRAQIIDPVTWSYSVNQLPNNEAELIFKAQIEPDWHMYSQFFEEGGPVKMTFSFVETKDYKKIGEVVEVSKPKTVHDDIFDIDVQYFENTALLRQKIKIISTKDIVIKGEFDYQVCYEDKCVLFTPEFEFNVKAVTTQNEEKHSQVNEKQNEEIVKFENEIKDTSQVVETEEIKSSEINETDIDTSKHITPVTNVTDNISLENGSLWLLFWVSFLAGLLAIFTPCVFPMIPMTVTFFMKGGENKTKGRFQALFYGLSIIVIYTVIGTLVAVLFGVNFANWLSTHWLPNILFFLIFMFFAASFLGMFEIVLPSWLVNKSDAQADKGGVWAPFFMAFTLVIVSFSCTGPLVGAILVKSAGGAVLEPIIGMLGFSLAFALPFTLFAFFPSWLSNLPKSGGWLNSVKVVLGFIEIALGFKFLSIADQTYHWGILDREIYLAIWIVLAILMGMYLLGKLKFSHDSDLPFISVPRFGLAIVTFTFAVYLIPGMWGAPLKALSGYLPPMSSHDFDVSKIIRDNSTGVAGFDANSQLERPKYGEFLHLPNGINGYFDYDQAIRVAKKVNKPIFVDFTGHGCVNCREMEANVWSDPRVLKMLKNDYVVVALYVDDKTKLPEEEWVTSSFDGKVKKTVGKKFADFQITRFEVNAQPYYVLLDSNGNQLVQPRAYDLNIEAFIEFLEAGKKAFIN